MRIVLAIGAVLLATSTLAAKDGPTGMGAFTAAFGIAKFLAYDEHCEKLPPLVKAAVMNVMQEYSGENQRTIEAARIAFVKALQSQSSDELASFCKMTSAEVREVMEKSGQ